MPITHPDRSDAASAHRPTG